MDEGFEFAKESPLIAKPPHLVSLSSDQFAKCTVCTIWNILRKPLKGKIRENFWKAMSPHLQNLLAAGAGNPPKFSANFSLSGSKGKLAELFGYYC